MAGKKQKIGLEARKNKKGACDAGKITQCATEKIEPLAQGSLIISQINLHLVLYQLH
jgi:hypothetical protein